ncbi:hypothetical protein LguiA_036518 [Lonicera macranthoides]
MYMAVGLTSSGRGAWRRALACGGREEDAIRRSSYNELVELQLENHLKLVKMPATNFIMKSSSMSDLIDSKRVSAINRVFQQIGFLSLQMSDKGNSIQAVPTALRNSVL